MRTLRLRASATRSVLLVAALALPSAYAQAPNSIAEYQAKLQTLHSLVAACRSNASACDGNKVGEDTTISDIDVGSQKIVSTVRWDWLRKLIDDAKNPKLADREKLLSETSTRLEDDLATAHGGSSDKLPFTQARARANNILSRAEFKHVVRDNSWQRVGAYVSRWLERLFNGASRLGRFAPWLGPLFEWGFVALAVAGLLVWVQRAMQRQSLAIQLDRPSSIANWQETSRNWATLAEAAANKSNWREAVHALYWAAVTELEGRRIWRQNNARTPREYLRLLQSESPHYRPLRALTQSLERIWYGLAPAGQRDYEHARALYDELRAA